MKSLSLYAIIILFCLCCSKATKQGENSTAPDASDSSTLHIPSYKDEYVYELKDKILTVMDDKSPLYNDSLLKNSVTSLNIGDEVKVVQRLRSYLVTSKWAQYIYLVEAKQEGKH